MALAWDPRSYLAEATAAHLRAVDVNAAATQQTDYYASITGHLEGVDTHNEIRNAVSEQRRGIPPPGAGRSGSSNISSPTTTGRITDTRDGVLHVAVSSSSSSSSSSTVGAEEEEARRMVHLHGLYFGSPLTVLFAIPPGRASSSIVSMAESAVHAAMQHCLSVFGLPHYHSSRRSAAFGGPPPPSDLERLNACDQGASVDVGGSSLLCRAVALSQTVHRLSSHGRFDPAAVGRGRAWLHQLEQSARRPQPDTATRRDGADTATIDTGFVCSCSDDDGSERSAVLRKVGPSDSALDLGAVAKGFTVDFVFDAITERVFPEEYTKEAWWATGENGGVLVEWGGELRAVGVHPLRRSPWIVGIPRPPTLSAMYRAWHAKAALPEPQFHVSYEMPAEGGAVAASGDYAQLFRYGYTHLYDPVAGEPLVALPHTVSGAVVVSDTCAAADALATALLLEGSLKEAVLLAYRARQPLRHQRSVDQPLLRHYFLYERNFNTMVTDTDGTGMSDEERALSLDKEAQRDALVQRMSQAEASALPLQSSSRDDRLRPSATDGDAAAERRARDSALVAGLRPLLRCRPAQLCIVSPGVFFGHPTKSSSTTTTTKSGRPAAAAGASSCRSPHAALVSSLQLLPMPIMRSTTGAAGGEEDEEGDEVVSSSSITGQNRHGLFHVMRGSALYNYVIEPGAVVIVYLLSSAAHAAQHVTPMRSNLNAWLSRQTTVSSSSEAEVGEMGGFALFESLKDAACLFHIETVLSVGDHVTVIGTISVASPPPTARLRVKEEEAVGSRQQVLSLATPFMAQLRGRLVTGPLTRTAAVLRATHVQYGPIGLPVRGVASCSDAAPVAWTCFAVRSCVEAHFSPNNEMLAHGGSCELLLLGGGASPFPSTTSGGGGAGGGERRGSHGCQHDDGSMRQRYRDPEDPAEGQSSSPEEDNRRREAHAESAFECIPFPAFRPAPGLVATIPCRIRQRAPLGAGHRLLVLEITGDPQRSPFGTQLFEAVASDDNARGSGGGRHTTTPVQLPLLGHAPDGSHVTQLLPVVDTSATTADGRP